MKRFRMPFWSMRKYVTGRAGRLARAAAVLLAALLAVLLGPTPAGAHGYTDDPPSRGRFCQLGEVRDCGDITYEPQSTEGPKGFPGAGPADGQLCSAGIERFAEVDAPFTPDGDPWPVTPISHDEPFTFRWTLTAPHATTDWRYYFTKSNYTRNDHPLTRADLDLAHPLIFDGNGQVPGKDVSHRVDVDRLPDLVGRHMMLAVWNIADTQNAFYSCADVYFE